MLFALSMSNGGTSAHRSWFESDRSAETSAQAQHERRVLNANGIWLMREPCVRELSSASIEPYVTLLPQQAAHACQDRRQNQRNYRHELYHDVQRRP